ncbi:MAG: enoyl-CoA hydratase/isomerase family protein [Burkholderiaceae bacterium]|nr:enoyl-CoA hydratase/isomerase family protein [Burkholderiales bacterium]MCZ8106378.1 enoyl-CoA hydratase/isomerase family protein [Burkholderiales bacterium]MCZ8338221.1 enoyl-CoA hydratase/isomerase family protein [Burkholderiaceae bacterium]
MTYTTLETTLQQGVAVIWLNRPDVRNAMSAELIAELTDAVGAASEDDAVRAIVLAGRGKAFCAGADLNWMKQAAGYGPTENEADAAKLATLLRTIAESPKPTLARVHGPAFAGGLGLVTACDIAVASYDAKFCLTEVKIGLIPAMISPYVIRAIGARAASRWMLTAEVFDGAEAYRSGLVQELAAPEELDGAVNAILGQLLLAGPAALAATKALIRDVAHRPVDDALVRDTARRIAAARASDEGREGIASFLEKRAPRWHSEA